MNTTSALKKQEAPGIAHDQTHTDLHQTREHKEISIQNLTHYQKYKKAADQVSETKPIIFNFDRMQIELTELKLKEILYEHVSRTNLKSVFSINKIWRKKLTADEINILMERSISFGWVDNARLLAKLRPVRLSKEEVNKLISSCINHGWYYQSPYKKELRSKILKLRLIPALKFSEKIAVYEMCKNNNWNNLAKEFAIKNPITFSVYFINSTWKRRKEFLPTEEQIVAYSK